MKRLFTGLVPFLFAFALLIGTALFVAPMAMANGQPETPAEPAKTPAQEMLDRALARNGKDVGCTKPTSVRPADYHADAKTWPCRNFSK